MKNLTYFFLLLFFGTPFLAITQPVNDNCSGAIDLPVSASCNFQTFNNIGGTTSTGVPIPTGACNAGFGGADIWFKAVVPASGQLIVNTQAGAITDGVMVMYTGTCSNLTQIACSDDPNLNTSMPLIDKSGLTPGNTVFIRFYDYFENGNWVSGDFGICAYTSGGPVEVKDLALSQVILPSSGCNLPIFQPITIRIQNLSTQPQSNFQVSYTINNGTPILENVGNLTIQPLATVDYTFNTLANLPPSLSPYSIKASTLLTGDQNANNNEQSTTFNNRLPLNATTVSNVELCQGSNITLTAFAPAGSMYSWSNNSATASITVNPTNNTSYTVTVTDNFGCTDIDTVKVTVNPLPAQPIISYSGLQLCQGGGSVTLFSSITTNIQWSNGANTPSIEVTTPGNYWVIHTATTGCTRISASVNISNIPAPTLTTQGFGAICPGGSEVITVNHNFQSATYIWSSGATSQSITVMPLDTTTYTVTITNTNLNCQYILEKTINTISNAPPGAVAGMLPPDGAQNLSFPLVLSWIPATNASHYNIYIWKQGDPIPSLSNPTFTVASASVTIYNGLSFNTVYNWRVRPNTPCNSGAVGITQSFKIAQQPDLIIKEIDVPTGNVFSGTNTAFIWMTQNIGLGVAGLTNWYDGVYLSGDSTCTTTGDDIFAGASPNPSLLAPQQTYTNTLVYNIANGVEGKKFVLVRADYSGNNNNETNESNNCKIAPNSIQIELTPPPDLRTISSTVILPGNLGNIIAGTSGLLSWQTVNQGLGKTNSAGWFDRVYLSKDTILQNDIYLGAFHHTNTLEVGQNSTANLQILFNASLSGIYYVFIVTDATNEEYEHNFEFNNTWRSTPINLIQLPKPDFQIINAPIAPNNADNNATINVSWTTTNQGIDYTGGISDYIYLSSTATWSGSGIFIGQFNQSGSYPSGGQFTRQLTVSLPPNISGLNYLIIRTDANGQVEEGPNENNNYSPGKAILIQSPNLILSQIVPQIDTIISGQQISINWNVQNTGMGNLLGSALTDHIELTTNANGTGPNISLGYLNGPVTIFTGNTIQRTKSFTIPITISGDYYLAGTTNANGTVNEGGLNTDNTSVSSQKIHIKLADFPDLQPLAISATTTIPAGSAITIQYSVSNNGNAGIQQSWSDGIYLTYSPTWSHNNAILLKNIVRSQTLPSGQQYNEQLQATIPGWVTPGTYYIFIVSDRNNQVFENTNELNNISAGTPIIVSVNPIPIDADLAISDIVAPATINPGVPSSLSWKTTNIGTTNTVTGTWVDRLYLSIDQSWSADDIAVAAFYHTGNLAPGQSYNRMENFVISNNQTSAFFLIIVTDADTLSGDQELDNNQAVLSPGSGGGGNPIVITFPPKPDLVISSVSTAPFSQAGQPVKVIYTIKNTSATAPAIGTTGEAIYRSNTPTGGIVVNQKNRIINLPPGGSLTDTVEILLPLVDSGNTFIIVRTNTGNSLPEENFSNNTGYTYTYIQQAPVGDLVVEHIVSPASAMSGNKINISWRLKNIGSNPVTGMAISAVYISNDPIWDASDILAGTVNSFFALAPGAIQQQELDYFLSGVIDTTHYVFVKADHFNQFLESDEQNNINQGAVLLSVSIPELPINQLTPIHLPKERLIHYRIEVPANISGEMLAVSVDGHSLGAFNEVYLRFGQLPNRTKYDFAFDQPFSEDQLIYIPVLQPGTYYLSTYTSSGPDSQTVDLLARIVPFELLSISANKGGNSGTVTVLLTGAKFDPNMQVSLKNSAGTIINGQIIDVSSLFTAYIRFDINGAAIGKYDVLATNAAQNSDTIINGFEIIPGTISNNPSAGQLTCSINGVTPFQINSIAPISFEAQYPASARPNQIITLVFRMENTGTVDIPLPRRILTSSGGAPLASQPIDLNQDTRDYFLEFAENNGPTDVLRPGGVSFRTVYTKAIRELKFNIIE